MKKVLRFLSSVLFYSIILILFLGLIMYLATFVDKKMSSGTKSPLFGAYVIISNSMVPHINVYDAVLTVRTDESKIQIDDIISFISKEIETSGTPITHRVIGIVYADDEKTEILGYRTKGDHNNTADFALIAPDEVIGKVFLRIPMIGYLQMIMTKPIGWLLIIVIPCLLIIGSDIFKLFKVSKMKDKNTSTENSTPLVFKAPSTYNQTQSKKKEEIPVVVVKPPETIPPTTIPIAEVKMADTTTSEKNTKSSNHGKTINNHDTDNLI